MPPGHSMERTFHVYILASASGVLYTGMTNNLLRRIGEHQGKQIPGFTQSYNVTKLVWFEVHGTAASAIGREKQIKTWGRAKKVALIEAANPQWRDLSTEFRWRRPSRRHGDGEIPRLRGGASRGTGCEERRAATAFGMTPVSGWCLLERLLEALDPVRLPPTASTGESRLLSRAEGQGTETERFLDCVAARSCLPRKLPLPGTFARGTGREERRAATSFGMTVGCLRVRLLEALGRVLLLVANGHDRLLTVRVQRYDEHGGLLQN
jgi:putative endonuclease